MRGLGYFAIFLSLSCAAPPLPSPNSMRNRWEAVPETPENAALRLWSYEHGVAQSHCVEAVHNTDLTTVTKEELQKRCNREHVAACMIPFDPASDTPRIFLGDDPQGQSYIILVHEYLHVLLWCHGLGQAEANTHSDNVWRHVPLSNLPEESPWYRPPRAVPPIK